MKQVSLFEDSTGSSIKQLRVLMCLRVRFSLIQFGMLGSVFFGLGHFRTKSNNKNNNNNKNNTKNNTGAIR